MSNVSSNSALSNLISQYGTDKAKAKSGVGEDTNVGQSGSSTSPLADQDVFMKLYIEQLKNQDPTSPQETGDMVSQMAQFSSLEQLTSMASQMSSMSESLISSQALTASTLVGSYVYVEQDKAAVTEGSATFVKTSFTDDSVANTLSIYDRSGNLVKSTALTDEEFVWDGRDAEGNPVEEGIYSFIATSTNSAGEVTKLSTMLPARINGVTINGEDGTTLNVADYGKLALTDELEILG
ncbi:flagellar biosynthesis protein FlgD [Marinomonas piezotolerans]|uniref:Basal-body rod modification protein FlgD n=1 Tax=Marinomonas piezotolerans TaxID=2213058 RepID=A0A370U8U0_9GAMM|nr:flagellar hook capping FlgD N-terminal domain-containing protein [Marinomonas piezotolerans]RDL44191.1 flagellar biosynthesis protein FlgD [Marinomonas piezotolerans]